MRSASPFIVVSFPTRDTLAGTWIVSSNTSSFAVILTVCSLRSFKKAFNSDAFVPVNSTSFSNAILSSTTFKEVLYSFFQLYSGVNNSFVSMPKTSTLFKACRFFVIFALSSSDMRSSDGKANLFRISSLSVSLTRISSDAT